MPRRMSSMMEVHGGSMALRRAFHGYPPTDLHDDGILWKATLGDKRLQIVVDAKLYPPVGWCVAYKQRKETLASTALTKWDMTLQSEERKIKAEPIVQWRTLFPLAAKALGAATVAAGVIAASVSGFNVGMSICAEICKAFIEWTSTSSEFKASGEVADKMNEALQDTLALEDERIANAQYSRSTTYKNSVESNSKILQLLLDRQSERMRKELLKRSTTQRHKDTMMEDMLGEVLDRQAKVMEAYTNEKILYQLQSLSSRLTSIRVGANGAPTASTAAGSMGDEDEKAEESDEKEEDDSDYEDGDEENSAYSLECPGGQESS